MVFTVIMTSFQCGNSITQSNVIVLNKSMCDQAHSDICNTNITFDNGRYTVDFLEMKAVIDDLASNKYPALDWLSAEQFKFAHSIIPRLMSTLVSSIVVHGHLPQYMNASITVPIIKIRTNVLMITMNIG